MLVIINEINHHIVAYPIYLLDHALRSRLRFEIFTIFFSVYPVTGELREGQFERPKLEHVELRPSVRAACASEERDLSSAARGS